MLSHEKEKRVIHCPRRAKLLLAGIDFNLERSVLGIPISKTHIQTEHISEAKMNSSIVTIEKTPLLKPKPARSSTSASNPVIASSSESHRERFNFNQFEAPLDPWEAMQDDFHELRSVLK